MNFQIESVARLSQALTRLESQDIDLVLLDLSLPDSQGLQTFHTLRKAAPDIPVIVLTGTDDQELATAAVRDGAQDYLVKGQISGILLFRAIRYALARHKAEQELARTAREWQTTFDATKDAIWILDENHRVLRTNKMAENYFNRPCSEMLGKPCWEIMHGTAEPIPDCPSVRARQSGNRETMDLQRGDRWFEVIVDPIFNAAGQYAGAVHIVSDITQRKRAEEEKRRQSLVINQTSETIAITDLEGIITDVNAAQCRALGRTREELIGKSVVDVYGGTPARNALQREIIETTRTRGQWFGEIASVSATGEAILVECRTWLLRDEQGKAIGMFGVGTDITARKQAEAALRDSRALYYSLVENLPQSIFRKDRAGRFQFVNERFCQDLKHSLVDIIGRTDADFFPPDLAQAYRQDDLRVMETGQVLDQEECHAGADGREAFVHVLKTPLRDAQGQIIGIQGVFWDITERKQAEEALRESEEKHRVLIETTATGFVIVDAQGRVLDANDEYARLSGYKKREQILGRSVTEWTAAHDQARNAAEVKKCVAGGSVRGLEVDYVHPDGTVIPIEINASTLGTGDDLKIVTLCRDITERKRTEAAMRESRALYHSLIGATAGWSFSKTGKAVMFSSTPSFAGLNA